ncbi:Ger(x)C family spore germination protein [Aquibacillus koreensis]|uniref:Ger(X)C family spore germination protein n=1 Tax=Aquibacillus koreensis TaxID=279446 RepID=A0A9X3WGR4_9BACI|nr:Ger(x)C family spore germination protein [Aquibacillus koreensis]MCT2536449.1 Ger(x)C family spore germination protein [Aquibacillus koreensis]MDC3419462.1 Ger(x)C family spore germination protein [Aquibacillus koreensis]
MRMRKYLEILSSLFVIVFLSGCWDSEEIENRAFIRGSSIDLAEQTTKDNPQLTLTQQLIVPAAIGTATTGGGEQPAFRNLALSGESLMHINNEISKRANRTLYAHHLEVLLFSEDVVKQPDLFEKLLDLFTREQQNRRSVLVAVTKEKASSLLDIEPEHIKVPSQYISELLDNKKSAEVSPPLRLGDLHEKLFANVSFVIPYLAIVDDKSIENSGVAVFNTNERAVIGTLDGPLTMGRNFMTGDMEAGNMRISIQDAKANIMIANVQSSLKLTNKDKNNLTFEIDVNISGVISETNSKINPHTHLDLYAKGLEKEVKKLVDKTITKAQTDLKTDIFKFNIYLYGHHYKLWESLKDEWDTGANYFANSKINVTVNANIEMSGNTQFTTQKEKGS